MDRLKLVLVPGLLCDAQLWRSQLDSLAEIADLWVQLTPLDRHEEMAAGIRGAKLEVLEDCGHMSTMEKPDQVNRAMRQWLA